MFVVLFYVTVCFVFAYFQSGTRQVTEHEQETEASVLGRSRRSLLLTHVMSGISASLLKKRVIHLESLLEKEKNQCTKERSRLRGEIAEYQRWQHIMSQQLKENQVEMANMTKTIDSLHSLLQKEKARREHFKNLINTLSPSPSFPSPSSTSPEPPSISTTEPISSSESTTTASTTSTTSSTTTASTTFSTASPFFNVTKADLSKIYIFFLAVACVCLLCFVLLKIKKIAFVVVNIAHSCLACVKCHQLTAAIQAKYERLRGCLRHQEEGSEESQVTINLIEDEIRTGVELRNLARGAGEGGSGMSDAAASVANADNITTTVRLEDSDEEEAEEEET